MARRFGTCVECGGQTASGERGKVPNRCASCQKSRQYGANRRWKDRNREAIREYGKAHYHANIERYREWHQGWLEREKEHVRNYRRRIYLDRQQKTIAETVRLYRKANPGKHAEIENRRRARKLAQFVAPVDANEIRARDRGMCGICGRSVAPIEQSLDHIVPLALGGTHEPANVQLAHRRCNSRKGARLLSGDAKTIGGTP